MHCDVVIIGGGPAGAGTALYLERHGIKSTILEKETFPRYHIGESLTGECGKCLRDLGLEIAMNEGGNPVKRGVKVYGPNGVNSFYVPTMGRCDEGNLFSVSTWQVRRSEFDQMLLETAEQRGARRIKGQAIAPILDGDSNVCGVKYLDEQGKAHSLLSKVVVDASGQATFLSNAGVCSEKERGNYDKQVAIFSQVKGAVRDDELHKNDTLIFYRDKNHWAWLIPLDGDTVSIGVTCSSKYFVASKQSKCHFLASELKTLNPELARRVENLEFEEPVRAISNYSYLVEDYTGIGFLCVGDAHRFTDPIFSYGVYFALKEAEFAADAIENFLRGKLNRHVNPFADYQKLCDRGQDAVHSLVDGFWNFSFAFAFFVHTRYVDEFIDLFSGRFYEKNVNRGLQALLSLEQKATMDKTAQDR